MKTSSFLFAAIISIVSFIPHVQGNDTSKYESLQEFCIDRNKDTRENCECGQATADKIMSSKEQTIALAFMQGNPKATAQLAEKRDEFMGKLSQVTNGCTQDHH